MTSQLTGEFPPLLFTLPSELPPPDYRTPGKPPLSGARGGGGGGGGGESSLSQHTRRSLTPPGSVHTEGTPPRPPPIMRLADSLMAEAEPLPSGSPLVPGGGAAPPPAPAPTPRLLGLESPAAYDDAWVTVFGFPPEALASVLREFQRCGDILQWGGFGAGAGANFVHIQFATRYGAQRALLKGGEQLSASLIVGVKPLDARHRAAVEALAGGGGGGGGGATPGGLRVGGAAAAAARPYRVDASAAAALPQRGASLWDKLQQFVIGV